jgi:23S rRNA-/tRNA-specific pseudouridylate synthase
VAAVAATLGDVVATLGAGGALADGRVFVDGMRVTEPGHAVQPGNVVEVHGARSADGEVTILAEHAGFVFVDKPPGVATEPDHAGIDASLVGRVARELGVERAELHALSRLDVGVSGVVALARTAEARDRAAGLRARGAWHRRYVALAAHGPSADAGTWTQALARPRRGKPSAGPERDAETRYAVIARARAVTVPSRSEKLETVPVLLALEPRTGRTHQLRLHAAGAGAALLGDATYGGATRLVLPNGAVRAIERVALHSAWVELELDGQRLRVAAPCPADLAAWWRELGGADDGWEAAFARAL